MTTASTNRLADEVHHQRLSVDQSLLHVLTQRRTPAWPFVLFNNSWIHPCMCIKFKPMWQVKQDSATRVGKFEEYHVNCTSSGLEQLPYAIYSLLSTTAFVYQLAE